MLKILIFLIVSSNIAILVSSTDYNHEFKDSSSGYSSSSSYASTSYSSELVTTEDDDCKPCKKNEKYVRCPSTLCQPLNCSQLGYPIPCPIIGPNGECPDKKGACICEDNYKRNDRGVCIPIKQCPSCGGDENAVSGCGINCGRLCSNYKKPNVACPAICRINGCDCKPKYVFDNNIKKCVLPEECTPICGKDEVYSECINGGCQAKNCSQIGTPVPCVKIDPKYCIKGCLCKEGYLRTKNGTCIPKDQCDAPTCGLNEVYSNCSNQICSFQKCMEVGGPIRSCPAIIKTRCKGGCICQEGYLRNTSGICVPKNQCDVCHGDPNAVPGCGVNCGRLCSNYDKGPVACPKICKINACDCKPDFVLDTNIDKCVRPKNCTPTCGKDEVYNDCVNGLCRAVNCSQKGKPIACPSLVQGACKGDCICKDGLLRADNGICVPEDECKLKCTGPHEYYDCNVACDNVCATLNIQNKTNCPIINKRCNEMCYCEDGYARNDDNICVPISQCQSQKCFGENEEWHSCPSSCPPQTCQSIGKRYNCPNRRIPPVCKGSCRCKKGFFRNKIGQCISKKNCLKCTGPREYFSCGGACDNVCKTLHKQNQTNCPIINVKCNEMCYCEKDYARDDNGTCIPIKDCKPQKCVRQNEEWDPCPSCPSQTCESIGKKYFCPKTRIPPVCKGSCRCKKGFVRNKIGECISKTNCLKCTGPHEYFSCGGACDNVCKTLHKQNQTNCPIINVKCNERCYCEKNYARDDNGTCIPIKNCKPPKCVRQNEEWDPCPSSCPPQTCESIGKKYLCPNRRIPPVCKGSCRCKKGFFRNKIGQCISKNNCLKCTGPHEYFACGGACDNVCKTLHKQNQTNCPIINVKCNEMCYCEKDYARDDKGTCIPIKSCKPKCCPKNEVWDECPAPCPPRRCDVDDRLIRCKAPPKLGDPECKPGCRCADGFARNNKGVCIPRDKCPKKCPKSEVWDECPAPCPPQRCDVDNRLIKCKAPPKPGDPECKPGCRCADNLVRNDKGICIPRDKCPKKCPKSEVWDECPAPCPPQRCDVDNRLIKCKAPPKPGDPECKPGCRCADNLVRNDKGICIPRDKCPKKCPKCEIWDECPAPCPPQRCDVDNRLIKCKAPPKPGDPECKPGCRCADNLVRNDKGICIRRDKCPKKCPKSEVWDECPAPCPPQRCDVNNRLIKCKAPPKPGDPECKPGCRCADDLVRNDKGICIPRDKCPKCPKPNEVWDECPAPCPPQRCDVDVRVILCAVPPKLGDPECQPSCRCVDGHVRNDTGDCVPKDQCPKCTGPHEYFSCGGACDNVCATLHEQNQTNCPIVNIKCNEMCYCEKDYARNDSGICIPIKDCKPPPPKCPEGEILDKCPPIKCDSEYCPKCRDDPQSCPRPKKCGKPRCVCGFNQHRDPCTGKCIPTSKCPPFSCDLPNEKYNSCPPVCPGETCTDYLNNATCPKYRIGIVVPCKPQCRCTKGHWRNSKGICVSGKKCELEGAPTTVTTTTIAPPVDDAEAQKRFEEGNLAFTGKFMDEVVKVNNGSSVIMSPFSVLFPLAQLVLYANGSSYDEMINTLQFKNKNEIRSVIPALIKSYEAQQNVLFDLAFKVFIKKNYELSGAFLNDSKNAFSSEAQNVDFGDPKTAAKIINDWVESKTNNLIKDLVSEQMFSALTRLVLANAIYFKGNWVKQFNPNDTTDRDFYLPNNAVKKVKTMYQKGSFRYAESTELDAKILELIYKGRNFTYLAILPNKKDGLNELVTKLRSPNALKNAISSLVQRKVIIYLPKIQTSLQIDLTDILKKLGITKIFIPGESGLYGILKKFEELYVSAAIQKATIIVNEVGSEAAAANAFVVGTTSAIYPPPQVYLFNADHPYVYYINLEDKPLFCGAYAGE